MNNRGNILTGILPDSFPAKLNEGSVAFMLSSAPEGKNYTAVSCHRHASRREKQDRHFSVGEVDYLLDFVFQTALAALASNRQPGKSISINTTSGLTTFYKTVKS